MYVPCISGVGHSSPLPFSNQVGVMGRLHPSPSPFMLLTTLTIARRRRPIRRLGIIITTATIVLIAPSNDANWLARLHPLAEFDLGG